MRRPSIHQNLTRGIFAVFCLAIAAIAAPQSATAQAERSAWGHYWADCAARKKPVHMVWIPGIWPQCLWGYPLDKQTEARSLRLCERFAPRAIRGKLKCVVAARNGRIVDRRLATLVRGTPPIPVQITIYDKATNKTQRARGTMREGKGPAGAPIPTTIYAGSARICSGSYSTTFGGSVVFTGSCFGETFKGRAKLNRVRRASTGYMMTPTAIRLTSKGSFIEVRF